MPQDRAISFSEDGLKIIQEYIENLRVDLGASVAMLLDESGELLIDCGWHADFDTNGFLALLGNEMSAANAVAQILQEKTAFDLHYHEGQNYEMYTVRITDSTFLTLIFERRTSTSGRVGMVWLTLRRAITELRALLNRALVKPGTAEDKEIHNAVSDVLSEALNLIEGDTLLSKPVPKSSRMPSGKTPKIHDDSPAPATPPPDISGDPHRVLSYEQARALGLIHRDDEKDDDQGSRQ